jgi:uncharacterized protein
MSGVTDLDELLATMEPALVEGRFVYASVPGDEFARCLLRAPIGVFREAEGVTLILPFEAADGLAVSPPMRMITLTVHSSLEALIPSVVSANVVAGYHHDHIFVPERDAERALETLRALSGTAREKGDK